MSKELILALLPLLVLAASILLQMLFLSFKRHHCSVFVLCVSGLALAFATVTSGAIEGGIAVTELLLFDPYGAFFSQLILLAALVCAIMAYHYFANCRPHMNAGEEFYILLSIATIGALVLVASHHFAALFIGLETLSIALFAMVAYPAGCLRGANKAVEHSLEAAIKYLVLSTVASVFLLMGVALIYVQTGALSFAPLQIYFGNYGDVLGIYIVVAMVLISVAVAFKLSLFPFHLWAADVYQGAPTPVTAFIACVSKAAVVAVFMRYFLLIDGFRFDSLVQLLALMAVLSMLIGNLLALTQNNIKRLLAYSSIAHMGYLMVAFIAAGALGMRNTATGYIALEALAFYLAAYFVTTLGAFCVVSAISEHGELHASRYQLDSFRGLFWRKPWLATCFILMLLSLAGIPLTIGFVGKFYLFMAGAKAGMWWLLLAVIIGSAIGLFYYLRIIMVVIQRDKHDASNHKELGALEQGLIYFLTLVLLWYGVFPAGLISQVQLM